MRTEEEISPCSQGVITIVIVIIVLYIITPW